MPRISGVDTSIITKINDTNIYGFYKINDTQIPLVNTNGLILRLDAANPYSYPTTGTTWFDISGNNNNGTLTNGPTFNPNNGGSFNFDGVNDYVDSIGTTSTLDFVCSSGTFSIGFWLNMTSLNTRTFFIGNTLTNVEKGWLIAVEYGASGFGNNCMRFQAAGNLTNTRLIAGSTNDNTVTLGWNHYFFTSTNGNFVGQWYINGSPVTTSTRVGSGSANQGSYYSGPLVRNLNVGRCNWTSTILPLPGNLANVLIYDRQLSSSEVLNDYNATKIRFT
jgi:hypothetical protein